MILLVTSKSDLTADYIVNKITNKGKNVFRFNTEDFPSKYSATISVADNQCSFLIKDLLSGREIDNRSLLGAYFRKPLAPQLNLSSQENHLIDFTERETAETLRSLWRCIGRQQWLNHPEDIWIASNKIKQLIAAREFGFRIPPTLVSTDTSATSAFILDLNGPAITKAVSHGYSEDQTSVSIMFTTSISPRDLTELQGATDIVPSIVQPQLSKHVDLRVTVVGGNVFSAALHSQEHRETEVDWRTSSIEQDIDLTHSRFQLPDHLEASCVELTQSLNLRFSCIDMIRTQDGNYYFLELNPNGEWAWIEETLNYPISESIINLLAHRK